MARTRLSRCVASAKRSIGVCCSVWVLVLVLIAPRVGAQETLVPKLGSPVKSSVVNARSGSQQCLTDVGHHDPCASVKIDKAIFTIAWDASTKEITYLFTDDRHLVMDSELGVGGGCRLVDESGKPDEMVQYMGWLVTPRWRDTVGNLSGDAVWYAALRKETARPKYG